MQINNKKHHKVAIKAFFKKSMKKRRSPKFQKTNEEIRMINELSILADLQKNPHANIVNVIEVFETISIAHAIMSR